MPDVEDTVVTRANVGRLLLRAFERFHAAIVSAVRKAGYEDIRPGDTQLFRNLDREGTRITELAERAGVTKQAMSQLVQDLESRGYAERRADPDDGRAKRVRLTEKGRGVLGAAREGRRRVEERWTDSIGTEGFHRLRALLLELLEKEDALPWFQDPLDWEDAAGG